MEDVKISLYNVGWMMKMVKSLLNERICIIKRDLIDVGGRNIKILYRFERKLNGFILVIIYLKWKEPVFTAIYIHRFRTTTTLFFAPKTVNRNRCNFATTKMGWTVDANSRNQVKKGEYYRNDFLHRISKLKYMKYYSL